MNYNNKNKSELTWIIKMLIDKNKMQKQTIIKQEKMLDTLYLDKIKLKPLKIQADFSTHIGRSIIV